jgi:hypothetical protein
MENFTEKNTTEIAHITEVSSQGTVRGKNSALSGKLNLHCYFHFTDGYICTDAIYQFIRS